MSIIGVVFCIGSSEGTAIGALFGTGVKDEVARASGFIAVLQGKARYY